jgi:hypothetical protein
MARDIVVREISTRQTKQTKQTNKQTTFLDKKRYTYTYRWAKGFISLYFYFGGLPSVFFKRMGDGPIKFSPSKNIYYILKLKIKIKIKM